MDKNSHDYVRETITVIETELENKEDPLSQICVQRLADMSFLSKNHYQRLFQAITGESVMEYIKKRKLSIARRELCETDISILDIALNHGYMSHEGFTRAFKAYFGVSPAMYRKKWKLNEGDYFKEELIMKTNSTEISVQRLFSNAETAAKTIDKFINEANIFSSMAEKLSNEEGRNAAAIHILIRELCQLISYAVQTKDSAQYFAEEHMSLFERVEKLYGIIKAIDDITFQISILELNSGIEAARMGKGHFDQVHKGFASLAGSLSKDKEGAVNLIGNLIGIISEDIRTNADELINNIINLLKHVAEEGKAAAGFIKDTAKEMGRYGKGFTSIADEIIMQVKELSIIYKNIENSSINEELFSSNTVNATQSLQGFTCRMSEIAVLMNILAFDTEIEAARAGGFGSSDICAEKMLKYAKKLQEVQAVYTERIEEIVKLPELFNKIRGTKYDEKSNIVTRIHKIITDVMFQGKLYAIQLRMEAERAGKDEFRNIAKLAEKSLKTLSDISFGADIRGYKEALKKYHVQTIEVRDRCRDDGIAMGDYGCCFRFMAEEYGSYIAKIENCILEISELKMS